eukprot:Rhum_TRINITY_DN4159_c1_g1::Rhum_TRINITY_DN4159_c1_g1_i1::g.13212::m.13212
MPMLTDPAVFAGQLRGPLPASPGRPSPGMRRHAGDLLKFGVARCGGRPPRVLLPAFTVPKKNGTARLVLDGRRLNEAMARPPPMQLPRLAELIREVKGHAWASLADGVAYFYQFPLHREVSEFFGMSLGRSRADPAPAVLALSVLCMGWSWAPCVAQRASRVLTRGLGLAWVDNFIILGGSRAEAAARVATFRARCGAANV